MIKLHDTGVDVGDVQQKLIEFGYNIDPIELHTTEFGVSTESAVKTFQNIHKLTTDGIVGPQTIAALNNPNIDTKFITPGWQCEPSKTRAEVRRVLEVAVGEIGVCAVDHRGTRVDQYNAPDNIGGPWCAAFMSWVFARGCDEGSPFGRLLSAYKISAWAKANNRVVDGAVKPGDIFVILRANFHGHVGLIVDNTAGVLSTCEGNAGGAVRGLIRQRSTFAMVVRPIQGI